MESSSFYVTLPSNASMDIYPKNKQSSFKVQLPKTLHLSHRYEVALSEIQFPVSWKTFSKNSSYSFRTRNIEKGWTHYLYLPVAYYHTLEEFVNEINVTLDGYLKISENDPTSITLQIDKLTQKVIINCKEHYRIRFTSETNDVLGLEDKWYKDKRTIAPYTYDISRGFSAMYVYCSVCAPQIVGNVYAPLLRAVAAKGERGDHIIKSYSEPHYIPVNTDEVNTIEINIKDDTARDVPFTFGKVICKLHFRQKTI